MGSMQDALVDSGLATENDISKAIEKKRTKANKYRRQVHEACGILHYPPFLEEDLIKDRGSHSRKLIKAILGGTWLLQGDRCEVCGCKAFHLLDTIDIHGDMLHKHGFAHMVEQEAHEKFMTEWKEKLDERGIPMYNSFNICRNCLDPEKYRLDLRLMPKDINRKKDKKNGKS